MRLFRPPYTVDEIDATPHDFTRPYEESERARMWQARIDYWTRLSRIAATCAVVLIVALVAYIVSAVL